MKRSRKETNPKESKKKKISQENEIIIGLKQHQREWGLDSSAIEEAYQRITGDAADVLEDKLLLFLYAKGILAEENFPGERNSSFRALLAGKTKKLKMALERLRTIVVKGETTPTNTPVGSSPNPISYFEAFVEQHPEWKHFEVGENSKIDENPEKWKKNNFVVFRDHYRLKGKEHALVERFQKSGLCYMHAPVVLQHYLVAMANEEPIPMLDMTKYLKQHMSPSQLYDHIWENKGGDSYDFLEKVLFDKLAYDDVILYSGRELKTTDLCHSMEQYGPALVSGFHVSQDFKDSNQWQHLGIQSNELFLGMHAMLLVGYRKFNDKNGKETIHYLLQNWWKSKAYVEVDMNFLASSKSSLRFITKKQTQMGNFPVNEHILVECDIDACEQFVPEG